MTPEAPPFCGSGRFARPARRRASPGSLRRRPRRTDPHPGRRRARLLRLVPALALLLGALSPFAAAPAQAQAVWSATLTVKEPSGNRGCYGRTGSHGCYTALDSYGFTKDGVDYEVRGLFVSTGQNNDRLLYLILDKTIPDSLKTLKLCVGTAGLVLSDGTSNNDNKGVEWSSNSFSGVPDWSVGETVAVSLASSCTQQTGTAGVTLSADNATPVEGGTVTVTATLDAAAPTGGVTLALEALDTVSKTIYTTATATDDYTLSPAAISIAGGQTTGTATLTVVDDQAVEDTWYSVAGETVVLRAESTSPALASNPLVVTILDNDGPFAGRRPGQPTLAAVTSGQDAPTATTLAFSIGCVDGSGSLVTDYVLWGGEYRRPDGVSLADGCRPGSPVRHVRSGDSDWPPEPGGRDHVPGSGVCAEHHRVSEPVVGLCRARDGGEQQ